MGQLQTQHEMTMSFYSEFGDLNVYAKQGDTQRFIQFEFTEEIIPESLDHFYAYVRGKYPDGSVIPIARINQSDIHEDYILFQIPSTLLALPGKVVCDLVLCKADSQPTIDPETGTIDDSGVEILSTHTFNIYVEAMATSGGSISEHTADQAAELVRLIIATEALIEVVEENEELREEAEEARETAELEREEGEENRAEAEIERSDAEIIRDINENGGSEELSDGTTYEVDYEDSRVGAEEIRQDNEEERIANEERREDEEQGYLAQTRSYAIGDETARPGSSIDNAEYYYEQSKEAVYGKGIMDLHIDDNGHLIYQRSDDLDNIHFTIQKHSQLILTIGEEPEPEPIEIPRPTMTANLTYTGTSQSPTWSNYEDGTVIFRGDISGIDAGTYTTYIRPAEGYCWDSNYPDEIIYSWSINKADRTIICSKNAVSITKSKLTDTIKLTYPGEGEVTINDINTDVATATVNNKIITITGATKINDTTSFRIIVNADNNYNTATSEMITVDVNTDVKIVSFSSGTDKEIADMLNAYYNDQITLEEMEWHVGATRTIHLNSMPDPNPDSSQTWAPQDIKVEIVATEQTDLAEPINGHTKACITVQTKEVLSGTSAGTAGTMYITGRDYTNNGEIYYPTYPYPVDIDFTSWKDLYMRTYLNNTVLGAIPDGDFKSSIKQSNHYRHTNYDGNNDELVTDTLFLPSYNEIFGTPIVPGFYSPTIHTEGTQFPKYMDTRVKYINNNGIPTTTAQNWWTSSPSNQDPAMSESGYYWVAVDTNGRAEEYYGGAACGLAPAFAM